MYTAPVELFLQTDPHGTVSQLSDEEKKFYRNQSVPIFEEVLRVWRHFCLDMFCGKILQYAYFKVFMSSAELSLNVDHRLNSRLLSQLWSETFLQRFGFWNFDWKIMCDGLVNSDTECTHGGEIFGFGFGSVSVRSYICYWCL